MVRLHGQKWSQGRKIANGRRHLLTLWPLAFLALFADSGAPVYSFEYLVGSDSYLQGILSRPRYFEKVVSDFRLKMTLRISNITEYNNIV